MAAPDKPPKDPPAIDPDNVQETLCVGKFNVLLSPPLATITFTHARPKTRPLMDRGEIDQESVVRARITTTLDNLAALRKLLNSMIQDGSSGPAAQSGGASKLN